MNWTQQICDDCWKKRNGEEVEPTRLRDPNAEKCCFCGQVNNSGIYIRVDPKTIPHASEE